MWASESFEVSVTADSTDRYGDLFPSNITLVEHFCWDNIRYYSWLCFCPSQHQPAPSLWKQTPLSSLPRSTLNWQQGHISWLKQLGLSLPDQALCLKARVGAQCQSRRLQRPLHGIAPSLICCRDACDSVSHLEKGLTRMTGWQEALMIKKSERRELQEKGWKGRLFWLLQPTDNMSHTHLFSVPQICLSSLSNCFLYRKD